MSHADTLRGMAKGYLTVNYHERADTCLAGAEALDTLERVRAVLADLRFHEGAALQRWEAYDDPGDGAAFDTLRDTIYLLNEALEGEK